MENGSKLGVLEVYTHGARLLGRDDRVKVACRRVLNNWVIMEEVREENARGETITKSVIKQLYGAAFPGQNDFWFHKGQLKELDTELKTYGLTLEDLELKVIPTHTPDRVKFNLRQGRVLRDYQEDAKRFALSPVTEGDHFSKLIAMPTGSGKLQPKNTPILTPDGWHPLGDLRVGDFITGVNGEPIQVLEIHEQGVQELYRVTFADGRTTLAGGPHLWKVHNYDWCGGGWRVKDTLEIMELLKKKKSKIRVPLYVPPDDDDVELPIDPYVLGALIGDGSYTQGQVLFTKYDSWFMDAFNLGLPPGNTVKRMGIKSWAFPLTEEGRKDRTTTLRYRLEQLGIFGQSSWEKTIPACYFTASTHQRMELIRGLMDTDGTADQKGCASFCTTSEKLAMQLIHLVRSCGGMASHWTKTPTYTHHGVKKIGRKAWNIHIRMKTPSSLFHLPRKKERMKDVNQYSERLALTIDKIEPAGFDDSRCIVVDHPEHLYVCNDYIVTHNTVTSCGTAADNGERLVVGVLPRYAKKWCKDLDDNLDVGKKGIMPVESISQLRGLIHICKEQGSKKLPPVIVITLSTMRMFLDKFSSNPKECVEDMGCEPWELMGLLGAGMFAIDEAHEHINTVFLTSMYLHGVKFVAMSGTMRTEDAFEEKVQNAIFPMIKRYLDVKMEKYIDVEFIGYNFHHSVLPKMKCSAFGRTDYSHPVLEKSIIKYPQVLKSYIRIITDLLDFDYIPRANGKRALVFVATVDMADKVVAALTARYPHLEIARYCAAQGDKYSDLLEADITVSTLQSSGTAVDIPNLISVVCSTMVNSSKANIQALGRLRKLPNDEKVTMYLPFCRQNKKHLKYMAFRHELFRDITKSIKVFNYDRWIGEPSY